MYLLTLSIGSSAIRNDGFVFLNAEKQTDGLSKEQLEERVRRLAGGFRRIIGSQDNDVVLAFTENSVRKCQLGSIQNISDRRSYGTR